MKLTSLAKLLRVNHWFKNIVVVFGVSTALWIFKSNLTISVVLNTFGAFFLASVVSSANYVINQMVDAPFDAKHPEKKYRPIPSGQIAVPQALLISIVLFALSFFFSFVLLPQNFTLMLVVLGIAGFLYNIPPIRLKDIVFIDVVSESANNPVRFLMGWFLIAPNTFPPIEILFIVWTAGAVLMTGKRYDELVHLGKKIISYRHTFKHYTPKILSTFMYLYATLTVVLYFIFVNKYIPSLLPSSIFLAWFLYWIVKSIISGNAKARDIESFVRTKSFVIFLALFLGSIILLISY